MIIVEPQRIYFILVYQEKQEHKWEAQNDPGEGTVLRIEIFSEQYKRYIQDQGQVGKSADPAIDHRDWEIQAVKIPDMGPVWWESCTVPGHGVPFLPAKTKTD